MIANFMALQVPTSNLSYPAGFLLSW